jgi:hypothetical protein
MTLWAKIGAGVIAALAVVGVGIYVAMPPECGSGQCGELAPKGACCSGDHSDGCPGDGVAEPTKDEGGCCAACSSKVDADAMAACGGGLTVQPSAKAKAKPSCCGE